MVGRLKLLAFRIALFIVIGLPIWYWSYPFLKNDFLVILFSYLVPIVLSWVIEDYFKLRTVRKSAK
jgi:hypothetical protein